MKYLTLQANLTDDYVKNNIKWIVTTQEIPEDKLLKYLEQAYEQVENKFKITEEDPYYQSLALSMFRTILIDSICEGKGIDCKIMLEKGITSYRGA